MQIPSKQNPALGMMVKFSLFGRTTLVRLAQPENAVPPMLVTLSGMVMLVRLEQPSNASFLIAVTLSGMVMLARLLQPANA